MKRIASRIWKRYKARKSTRRAQVGARGILINNGGSLTISGTGSMTVGGNLSTNGTITTGYAHAYLNSSGYLGYKPTGRRNKVWRLGRFTIIWRR